MKEFNLIEGKGTWKLGAVTPRREKLLAEIGLVRENFDSSKDDNVDTVLKKMLDELGEPLLKLLNGLFIGKKIEKNDLEDLDKTAVKVAVFSFFMSDLELFNEFSNLAPILNLQKSTTQKPDSTDN